MDELGSRICTKGSARPAGAARHLRRKRSAFEAGDVTFLEWTKGDH